MDNMNKPNEADERLELVSTEIFKNGDHLKLVNVSETGAMHGTISYIDFAESKTEEKINREEVLYDNPEESHKTLSLKLFVKSFELKKVLITCPAPKDVIDGLTRGGLDANAEILSALVHDTIESHKKAIVGTINVLAEKYYESTLKWYHKFYRFFVKSYKRRKVIKNERQLLSTILLLSNVIAVKTRRGAANFAIVNSKIGTILSNQTSFVLADNSTVHRSLSSLERIGSLAGITIYVDKSLGWKDNEIVVGRAGKADEPGLHFVYNPGLITVSKNSEPNGDINYAMTTGVALPEVGFFPENWYAKEYINLKMKI